MRRFLTVSAYFILGAVSISALRAQVTVTVQSADVFRELRTGETLTFDSEGVGKTITQRFVVSYQGDENAGNANIGEPTLSGSTRFSVSSSVSLPADLLPGESLVLAVSFTPTGVGPFAGRLNLPFEVRGRRFSRGSFVFNLSGRVPDYNLSFQLPGGNQTAVNNGGVVLFEDTGVGDMLAATMIVANRGSGPGTLETISIDGGEVFELGGLGLLPAEIEPGREFRFQVKFMPTSPQSFSGSMMLGFGGETSTVQLSGNGVTAYSYTLTTTDGQTTSVPAGGTIDVGSTPLGEELVSRLTVTNIGAREGAINGIAIAGDGYSLSDRPLLPALLNVGESFTITIHLTPTEPGLAVGQLRIGSYTFDLAAEALGGFLTYTFDDSTGSERVEPRGMVVFPQTQIGDTSEIMFQISNSGNEAAMLSGIGVGGGVFSLNNLPELPGSLEVGETIAFSILFAPDNLGLQSATLAVNAATFTLSGIGAELPDLPAVTFSTSGGTVAAADSIPLSLSIAEAFPVDIVGLLSLTFDTAAFSNDPSIQFSTGGRNAQFLIPKGGTEAIFRGNVTTNPFLTGTVAGTITATATFTTETAKVNITPDTTPAVVFMVAKAAPSLRNLALGSTGQGRFSVLATGFATSRSVSQLEIAFSGVPGSNITTPSLTVDAAGQFGTYYGSNQSSSFGSQFTATINFTVNDGEFEDISSVTITASNEMGQSNTVDLQLN